MILASAGSASSLSDAKLHLDDEASCGGLGGEGEAGLCVGWSSFAIWGVPAASMVL